MLALAPIKAVKLASKERHLTKRALDGWDSVAFSGFIYTQAESCSRSFIYVRPPASNANRWADASLPLSGGSVSPMARAYNAVVGLF
jgi:hypothetical protein